MNWAIGHGSNGGLCERKRGKCRIKSMTNSTLVSQKPVSNSRSSSGVNKSEEKIAGGVKETAGSGAFGWRFRRWVFMVVLPKLRRGNTVNPLCPGERLSHAAPHSARLPSLAIRRDLEDDDGFHEACSFSRVETRVVVSLSGGSQGAAFPARGERKDRS